MPKKEIFLPEDLSELKYIDAVKYVESERAKDEARTSIINKIKKNPFVPLGVITTSIILGNGFRHFYRRDSFKQQIMMRRRILSQFSTLFVFAIGAIFYEWKENQCLDSPNENLLNYSKLDDVKSN